MTSVLKAFICPTCGLAMKTVKVYFNHSHKNETHGQYTCCIVGCKFRFTKYNSSTSPIYCHHRQRQSSVSRCEPVQGPLKWENQHCQERIYLRDLSDHLRSGVSKKEEVQCPFKGCGKAVSLRSPLLPTFLENIEILHLCESQLCLLFILCLASLLMWFKVSQM